jgi:glycosyltransferase involved in cell wall biosynthesis
LGGDWRFEVIGSAEGVRERLGLAVEPDELPWVESVEDYHVALGRLTLGIVPLGDTAFNASKSFLKGIELAARGIPFVASPRAEYRALGLGILAPDRSRNWRRAVTDLMRDESLRVEMAEYGREVVRAKHTFEGNGHRWAEAWSAAVARRRALGRHAA